MTSEASESPESRYGILNRAMHWLEKISKWVAILGAIAVIIMMFSIAADVIARKMLGKPIPGVAELNELFMAVIIFLGLGITQMLGKNVRMDAVITLVSPRARHYLNIVTTILVMIIVALLGIESGKEAIESVSIGEFRFGSIQFPVWPSKLAVPIGGGVLFFVLTVDLLRRIFPAASVKGSTK